MGGHCLLGGGENGQRDFLGRARTYRQPDGPLQAFGKSGGRRAQPRQQARAPRLRTEQPDPRDGRTGQQLQPGSVHLQVVSHDHGSIGSGQRRFRLARVETVYLYPWRETTGAGPTDAMVQYRHLPTQGQRTRSEGRRFRPCPQHQQPWRGCHAQDQ